MAADQDKRQLSRFIHELFEWLDWCHGSHGADTPSNWPVLHPLVIFQEHAQNAWAEFSSTGQAPEHALLGKLEEVSENDMAASGMLGAQLQYKLEVFWHRAGQAIIGGVRAKERFADYLMILLDSLLDMLGVAGTAIKELVGTLKAQIRA